MKLKETEGEHVKLHIDSNASSGLNREPWCFEVVILCATMLPNKNFREKRSWSRSPTKITHTLLTVIMPLSI